GHEQDGAGRVHGHMEPCRQEERKVDKDGPVTELEGGEQGGNACHDRRCKHAGIEHWVQASRLLPDEQEYARRAAGEAYRSCGKSAVTAQEGVDREAERERQQYNADWIQSSPFLIV